MASGIEHAPPVAPDASVPPSTNTFQRLVGVLFSPGETFADIARRPDVVGPLIVLVLLSFLTTVALVPRMDFDQAIRTQMQQSGREMSDADLEQAMRFGRAVGKMMAYTGPLWGILVYAIIAGALLLAFRLFGGEGTFKQAFSVTLYSWLPLAISGIIMAIVGIARGSVDPTTMQTLVKSNPAFLVDMKEQPVLFSFLASFDVFTLWTIVLLVIGFAAFTRISRAKSAAIVISLWLVTVVIKLGFAALGAARIKG